MRLRQMLLQVNMTIINKCILVGEGGAFESGCRKFEATRRDTVLLEL